MAEKSNQPNITLPQRTITITGEYSARMCQNTVRVSRIEQRAIQIAMAPPAIRDAGRRAMDRFAQATAQFESELAQIERELEASSRGGNRRRNGAQARGNEQRQNQGRDNAAASASTPAKAAAKPTAKPAASTKDASKNGASKGEQAKPVKPSATPPTGQVEAASKAQPSATQNDAEPAKVQDAVLAQGQAVEAKPVAETATASEGATPANLEAL